MRASAGTFLVPPALPSPQSGFHDGAEMRNGHGELIDGASEIEPRAPTVDCRPGVQLQAKWKSSGHSMRSGGLENY